MLSFSSTHIGIGLCSNSRRNEASRLFNSVTSTRTPTTPPSAVRCSSARTQRSPGSSGEQPFPRWDVKVEYPGGHDEENENHNHNTGGETQLVDECAHEKPRLDTDDALPGSIYAGRSEGSYV